MPLVRLNDKTGVFARKPPGRLSGLAFSLHPPSCRRESRSSRRGGRIADQLVFWSAGRGGSRRKKAPGLIPGLLVLIGRRPTLPHTRACSTIGAERLNYRVRDGNGWDPLARITQSLFELIELLLTGYPLLLVRGKFYAWSKFYGQAERAISTGKLNVLLRLHIRPINVVVFHGPSYLSIGRSHLEEGFALICFQRLSRPKFATQLCHWRDNWNTRALSTPVLSY